VEILVARAPDLAHPPRAYTREELVLSKPHADGGGHGAQDLGSWEVDRERDYAPTDSPVNRECPEASRAQA
jgi:hypothetical protein